MIQLLELTDHDFSTHQLVAVFKDNIFEIVAQTQDPEQLKIVFHIIKRILALCEFDLAFVLAWLPKFYESQKFEYLQELLGPLEQALDGDLKLLEKLMIDELKRMEKAFGKKKSAKSLDFVMVRDMMQVLYLTSQFWPKPMASYFWKGLHILGLI
jgi:hypothetical protein